MALPKRRHSATRGRKRRTHWKVKASGLSPCPQCKQPKIASHVCPSCGFYKGKQVIEIKIKEKKKKK